MQRVLFFLFFFLFRLFLVYDSLSDTVVLDFRHIDTQTVRIQVQGGVELVAQRERYGKGDE